MRVQFVERTDGPERLVCEAELVFDEAGPLWNTKLVGFALWRGEDGDFYVTFPSRAFGAGPERRYYDYLRAADGDAANIKNVKSWIIAEYRRRGAQPVPDSEAAPSARSRSASRRRAPGDGRS